MDQGDLTCRQLVALVTEHLEGALPPEVDALFAAHLEDCAACGEYVAQMRRTVAALGALPAENIGHAACARLATAYRSARSGASPEAARGEDGA